MAKEETVPTYDIDYAPVLSADTSDISSSSSGNVAGITSPSTQQTVSQFGKQYFGSADEYVLIDGTNKLIQSSNFSTGVSGWVIYGDGSVEFNNGTFRGAISASTIDIGGSDATSFHVDVDGNMWLGAATFAAAPFSVSNAGAVTLGSVTLVGGTIRYGKTSFTDSTNAGYYMSSEGVYFGAASDASKLKYTIADGTFDFIGTVSSRSTVTIASTINSSGNVITDLVNARLDTSAKTMLAGFTFGAADYAGALNSGTITWNTTTGAITGGSGVLVYRGGIIGAAAGVATFTIDSATGAATFAGALSAPTGTIGGFTIGATSISATAGGNTTTISSGTTAFSAGPTATPSVTITQAGVLTATGAVINGSPILNQDIYGDGSDGTVTISTDTTLTSDMFYDSLTISTTGTDTSSPITGATAGDGSATRTSANSVFSTIRTSATGTATDAGVATTNVPTIVAGTTSSRYSTITRGMLVFPTSGIPDGATITSATLQLYVTAKSDQMSQSVSIVTRTDPGTIASADYDIANWTMTKQATDVTIASVTTSAYNTWTLNATGLASISKTGSTVFGVVMSGDADNSAPTWSSGAVASITYDTADNGSNQPILTVSYSYSPTLNPGGYRIHVKDTLTVDGTISRAGNAGTSGGNGTNAESSTPQGGTGGTAGAAGAAHADGSIKGSVAGTAGTAGANGVEGSNFNPDDGLNSSSSTAGTSVAKSLTSANGSAGGRGGAGGTVDSPVSDGGTAGTVGSAGTVSGTVYNKPNTAFAAWLLQDFLPSADSLRSSAGSTGGTGGASGGQQTSSYTTSKAASGGGGGGGGAGSAGGIVAIFARTIVIDSAGSISVSGGNGGNGGNAGTSASQIGTGYAAAGGSGGGGGGAGGSGGVLILVYSSLTNSGTITYAGGTGGTAGTKSVASLAGSGVTPQDGVNGSAGSNGSIGKLVQLQV